MTVSSSRAAPSPPVARLQLIALLGLCSGVWGTRPLWTADHAFPQIPWLHPVCDVPPFADPALLAFAAIAVVGLVTTLIQPRFLRLRFASRIAFSLAIAGLVLLDQHRLQPWILHLVVVMWLLWLAPDRRGLSLVRVFVISIYVHSALSRCDRASLEQQWDLFAPLLERWELTSPFVVERVRLTFGALFAAAELVVAILLAVPRWRPFGRWASIALHAGLFLALGPLGLGHHGGVLVWNAVWIAQNWVLFARSAPEHQGGTPLPTQSAGAWRTAHGEPTQSTITTLRVSIATAIAAINIVAPLLEPWGWWDHWPGWRLYSARPAVVTCYVRDSRVPELPAAAQQFVGPPEPLSDWRPLNLDAWSFAELRCPVYPQERFRLAVILAVAREARLNDDIRVVIGSPPECWTGKRETRELMGEHSVAPACDRYFVNTSPRQATQPSAHLPSPSGRGAGG